MGIEFILMVNKQGQTRLSRYYSHFTIAEKNALESEIIRKCLGRTELQVNVYRIKFDLDSLEIKKLHLSNDCAFLFVSALSLNIETTKLFTEDTPPFSSLLAWLEKKRLFSQTIVYV